VSLRIVPVSWREAQAFVAMWHRTHPNPPRGFKFCLGVATDLDVLVGVAIAGRPVARNLQDGLTLEVNRTATDSSKNAGSMLYGASARAARALGWGRVITYTQDGESGASLRAAGWCRVAERRPQPGWDRPGRPRESHGTEQVGRTLWERTCNQDAQPWKMPSRPASPLTDGFPPTLWEATA
jgi:hypothetical protein